MGWYSDFPPRNGELPCPVILLTYAFVKFNCKASNIAAGAIPIVLILERETIVIVSLPHSLIVYSIRIVEAFFRKYRFYVES